MEDARQYHAAKGANAMQDRMVADVPEWPVHHAEITLVGLRQAKQQRRARSPA